jgi:hypothetical protein
MLVYLCTPYGHKNEAVVEKRIRYTAMFSNHLISRGITAISLAIYGHTLVDICGSPSDWGYWSQAGHDLIDKSDELWVIEMDGWDISTGVKGEVEYGLSKGKTIKYFRVEEIMSM